MTIRLVVVEEGDVLAVGMFDADVSGGGGARVPVGRVVLRGNAAQCGVEELWSLKGRGDDADKGT